MQEHEAHVANMRRLGDEVKRLLRGRSLAAVVIRASIPSKTSLGRDWLQTIVDGSRKNIAEFELRILARGLAEGRREREEATERLDIYHKLRAIVFPAGWGGGDA